jgi:hypothetical protein
MSVYCDNNMEIEVSILKVQSPSKSFELFEALFLFSIYIVNGKNNK